MWNPFKRKKREPILKIGDLILGYKFRYDDVWHAYGQECLGYVASVEENGSDNPGYKYDICWLEAGIHKGQTEESVVMAREEYIKKYGQAETKSW